MSNLATKRLEQLMDMGFKIQENVLVHEIHSTEIIISSLGMFKEDSYVFFLQALADEQETYKKLQDKEKRLYSDKKQIEDSLLDFRGFLANVKNAESINFMKSLNTELNSFIKNKLKELKTL